jgi:hypothetical protein
MVQEIYGAKLRETDIFAIDRGDGKGQERWETLSKRVTEHVYFPLLRILMIECPCCCEIFHSHSYGPSQYLPGSFGTGLYVL